MPRPFGERYGRDGKIPTMATHQFSDKAGLWTLTGKLLPVKPMAPAAIGVVVVVVE
jgi:hypothetical protein